MKRAPGQNFNVIVTLVSVLTGTFLLLFVITSTGLAADCSAVFPSVLQNGTSSGSISFGWNGQALDDSDNILESANALNYSPWSFRYTCGTAHCTSSMVPADQADLETFEASSGTTDIAVGWRGTFVLGGDGNDNYDDITGSSEVEITDNGAFQTYYVDSLQLGWNSRLVLQAGSDYWFGNLDLSSGSISIVVQGTGTARLFVQNQLNIGWANEINGSGAAEKLLIVAYGDVVHGAGSSGSNYLLYSKGDVSIGDSSNITGAISAEGDIVLENSNATLWFDSSAPINVDHRGICDIGGAANLLVEYRFDEMVWTGAASEVRDSSGNGNDATAINGPATEAVSPAVAGSPGTCRYGRFGGSGEYVEDPGAAGYLDGLSSVTVMAWIRNIDTIGNDRGIFTTGEPDGNDNRFGMRYDDSGNSSGNDDLIKASVNTSACADSSDCLQVETESDLQLQNGWQHVAMTWESGDKIRIFINGSEVQTTVTGSGIGVHNGTLDGIDFLRIGQGTKSGSPSPEWMGDIDEFRIYDRKMDGAQITQAMNESHSCVFPLAEYRFEGCDWTTGATVTDELGNYPGVVVQGAHTAAGNDYGGGLCNVANLENEDGDYNRYISLSSNPIPLAGDWTLMMWINLPPEFDNHFSSGGYRYSVLAGGTNDLCWIRRNNFGGAMEWGASSNPSAHRASFPSGLTGWHHLAFVGEGSETNLYVDGAFYSDVDYKQTGAYTRMGTSADDAFIGPNSRQNLDTQLDELKFYDGALSAGEISDIYALENSGLRWNGESLNCQTCGNIDHIRIEHTGMGLTCQRSDITLRACVDADCTAESPIPVTVTMSPSSANPPVWIGGDSYTFTGNSTIQLRQTTPADVTLGVDSSNPVPTNGYRCYGNGIEGDCSIEFFESGFIYDVPDLTSCQSSPSVEIQAVRMDETSQKCVADGGFASTSKDVNFWSTYVNPGSGSENVAIGGTNLGTSAPGTAISLNFDATASSSFVVRYPDAGQMQLNARYDSVGAEETGLVMLGGDGFIARPVGLCVYSDAAGAACVSGDGSCTVFRKVDENFPLKVKGVCWQSAGDTDLCTGNATTPNFELSNISLSHSLIAPTSGGSSPGALGVVSVDITPADNGEHEVTDQTISEVGVFTVTATPPNYFGQALSPATSANIGRFIPDHFETAIVDNGALEDGCSGFTYTGQSTGYLGANIPQMQITATNSSGGTTVNYRDDFVKLTDPALQIGMPSVTTDSSQLGKDGATLLNLTWSPGTPSLVANDDGTLTFTLGDDEFTYTREENAQVDPFTSDIQLAVNSIVDDDGVAADDLPKSFAPAGTELRYGRMLLQNAYGPETLDLTIPVRTEYYIGSAFVRNDADNCTTYDAVNSILDHSPYGDDNLDPGETTASTTGGTLTLSNGTGNGLWLSAPSAPGADNDGSVDITLDLSQGGPTGADMEWLQPAGNNPTARATFGIFSGNQDLIYMRESIW